MVLPQTLPLVGASRFGSGDAIFVTLTDLDQDVDPFAQDYVTVDITVVDGADVERVRLTETAASSGVFTGFLQTQASAAPSGNDCRLQAAPGSSLEFDYVDPADDADTASATALLDPGFVVFSSLSGAPVDGARVTLLDAATGAAAEVFAGDGTSAFPASVVSGDAATGADGQTVEFAPCLQYVALLY